MSSDPNKRVDRGERDALFTVAIIVQSMIVAVILTGAVVIVAHFMPL